MVTILEFHPPEHDGEGLDTTRAPVKHPRGRSAEIIIFPGVRIEHNKEDEKVGDAVKTRKRTKRTVRPKR
ncbi:MAG: hypothetical protein ACTSP0_05515 [Alphaproteobacteria bacterium]